jgi:hypothetical protein
MANKTQYWLVTTKKDDCSGYATFPISEHPAEYIAREADEALIFAMPITKRQFVTADEAWRGN